jgi:hypothetical protein
MNEFDESFRKKFQSEDVKAYTEFYDETMKLMKSEDLKAFDLARSPPTLAPSTSQQQLRSGSAAGPSSGAVWSPLR